MADLSSFIQGAAIHSLQGFCNEKFRVSTQTFAEKIQDLSEYISPNCKHNNITKTHAI